MIVHLSLLIMLWAAPVMMGTPSYGEDSIPWVYSDGHFDPLWTPTPEENNSEETNTIPNDSADGLTTTPAGTTEPTTTVRISTIPTTVEIGFDTLSLAPTGTNTRQYYSNFVDFESKTKSYMNKMKSNLLKVLTSYSNSFHSEVQQYFLRSPSNRTIDIKKHTREVCDCDGKRVSPCPLKCLHSCYGSMFNDDLQYYQDCKYLTLNKCECYAGSHEYLYCDRDRSMDDCFTTITETIPADTKCLAYRIDDRNVSKSFEAFLSVLAEPIKKHFRGIETELFYLGEMSVSVDELRALVQELCLATQGGLLCANEGSDRLQSEISDYQQIKANISRELFSTQKIIRDVYRSFKTLKEQHFKHISESLEKYACCLKASDFSIPNLDCSGFQTSPNPDCPEFACNSGKCIPYGYLCDGGKDCPGGEDETSPFCQKFRG